jgi:hypothetical protein
VITSRFKLRYGENELVSPKIKMNGVVSLVLAMLLPATFTAYADTPSLSGPIDQGAQWTANARKDFYSRDQGSRLMPLQWLVALRQANGEPFLADSLGRYGYLPNPASTPPGIPVGFTVSTTNGIPVIGMTCAACHTREIQVAGAAYRIDGGPAIVDFQQFLTDLDSAGQRTLNDKKEFTAFATVVLGPSPSSAQLAQLRSAFQAWFGPYDLVAKRALPSTPWGPARADAVGMIFNRLSGVDIGATPDHLIPDNIKRATAPVRYPFLWNAPLQDKTQWPGFADNGNDILGIARNLGEVYGVFAQFHPKKDAWRVLGIDYWADNSANFQGLQALEDLIRLIGPPKWPWPVDQVLANEGQAIFNRPASQGGCGECHATRSGATRFFNKKTWATQIQDVGTDTREYDVFDWIVSTGTMNGAGIPGISSTLKPMDSAFNVLRVAVTGSILQYYIPVALSAQADAARSSTDASHAAATAELRGAFNAARPGGPTTAAFESRVLEGIWAAAPYLHNGSVPTLAELLKPAADRVQSFKIGPAYDIENVGLAPAQEKFAYVLETTGCEDKHSGNSRCGHEFGTTTLTTDEKRALLEYLKIL